MVFGRISLIPVIFAAAKGFALAEDSLRSVALRCVSFETYSGQAPPGYRADRDS